MYFFCMYVISTQYTHNLPKHFHYSCTGVWTGGCHFTTNKFGDVRANTSSVCALVSWHSCWVVTINERTHKRKLQKTKKKQKLGHWIDLFGNSLKLISHQFLTLTLASKTQSQAARQTSAKVLAKCLRETNKNDAFNIPWNVPTRCLKFDSLKFSLKKGWIKDQWKNWTQKSDLKASVVWLLWWKKLWHAEILITDTCNDRKAIELLVSCFPKVLALRLFTGFERKPFP